MMQLWLDVGAESPFYMIGTQDIYGYSRNRSTILEKPLYSRQSRGSASPATCNKKVRGKYLADLVGYIPVYMTAASENDRHRSMKKGSGPTRSPGAFATMCSRKM